ncbi:MAG: porin [Pseudomonadota bacterium]
MRKYRISAFAAAVVLSGGFAAGTASAADFGGDCCADLEERVAELEATTARKGNRKVSLTVSGFVSQQVMAWDDGFEDNVYITDTGSVSIGTNFSFSGTAQITPDYSAGFAIKIEAINNDSLLVNQDADDANNALALLQGQNPQGPLAVESAYWFIKSKTYGRVSVGQQSSAVDNQAIIVDGSGSLVQANYVLYDINSFAIRRAGAANNTTGLAWSSLANCQSLNEYGGVSADCDGVPNNNVRYDSPTYAGFSASASWGEDDIWGVSGRYAGTFGDFKLAAALAYGESSDEGGTGLATNTNAAANGGLDVAHLQAGGYIQHMPTGLFLYGAYGTEFNEVTSATRGNGLTNPEGENFYIKAGIRQRWTPFGATVLYGEYGQNNDRIANAAYNNGVSSSELEQYGLGIVQEIDAAAMSIWLSYRHYEADVTCDAGFGAGCGSLGLANGANGDLEDMDIVKFGALIAF